ncbi:hypothetical protein JW978_04215 [Candidatus Dojkabacteria bacterium]|nr:hypothetical protein [Candidatus Dojkabacteria bacterium]
MITTAIITDGGIANRYMPYSKSIPKGMLSLGDKPIIHLITEECMKAGMKKIYIVTSDKGKAIYKDYFYGQIPAAKRKLLKEKALKDLKDIANITNKIQLEMIVQSDDLPYGNGTPLLSMKNKLKREEGFLYLYSDNITFGEETSAEALMNEYKKDPEVSAYIAAKKVTRKQIEQHGSIAIKNKVKKIVAGIVEKPLPSQAPSLLASYGRYLLTNSIFNYLKEDSLGKNNEIWTSEAIDKLAKSEKVKFVVPDNRCMTTGDPDNYLKTCIEYSKKVLKSD